MQSDYYINLHFNQAVAQRTGYAFKIGDKGCTFHLHCEDLDPNGMLPHIVFNHPNNTCVEGVPTGSGRDYAYTIQGNEFAVIGKTVVDLKFYDALDATQRISTASFMIEIIPDTYTDFEEASSSYSDSLERAREELDEATSDLADMDALFAQTLQDYIDAFGNTAPINPRGAYDPNELYKPRDVVYYTSGGKTLTYLNNLECTGVDPTNTSNWQPIIDITGIPAIIDNCTSTSTTDALSANQGRVLNENKAERADLATINITGSTNNTGSTIAKNTLFYLNGSLCRATEYILNGSTFTLNTNFRVTNIGGELYGESGTFTLTPTSGSYTDGFTSQTNNYVRVGGLCLIYGTLVLAGNADISHFYVTCSGLPFSSNSFHEVGFARVANNGKVSSGVRHDGGGDITLYFGFGDGTYPTAGDVYQYTLMIRVY